MLQGTEEEQGETETQMAVERPRYGLWPLESGSETSMLDFKEDRNEAQDCGARFGEGEQKDGNRQTQGPFCRESRPANWDHCWRCLGTFQGSTVFTLLSACCTFVP